MTSSPFALAAGAFLGGAAATYALTPLAARLAHKVGAIDVPGGRRVHAQPTPRLGGVAIFGGLAVGQQQNERILLDLIHTRIDDVRLRELFSPHLDDADFELLRQVKISRQLSDEALEVLADLPRLAGSNAWAISLSSIPGP